MYRKDLELAQKWARLVAQLEKTIGKRPRDLNAVLFLIGIQELGGGKRVYGKEEKQDLMHIAICKVLSYSGFYELEGRDEDGWPHFKLIKNLPHFDLLEQEHLLKMHIIEYFEKDYELVL